MPLHPQAAQFLEQIARQQTPPMHTLPVELTRRALLMTSGPEPNQPTQLKVEDRTIRRADGSELPVRIYTPDALTSSGVCLYFHGGGWVLNSIQTHDDLVRRLTAAAGCRFINVDYRLAPEHKYPAAIDDAYLATVWASQQFGGGANRLAVAGDSAGGNLAAAACLMSRDLAGPKIALQALIYPITDCDFDRPSYHANADGYFLSRNDMIWFWNLYVASPNQMREPYASPMRATSLANLPPALVLTAEYDPLCDEGEAYARALSEAGVPVKLHRFDGLIHAFMKRIQQFDAAKTAIQMVADELKTAFKR